jgi:hypothetical protein
MNLEDPKFTVVVPLIPQHDFEVKRILKLLANEQNLIERVIICRSETKDSGRAARNRYKKYAESVEFLRKFPWIVLKMLQEMARTEIADG